MKYQSQLTAWIRESLVAGCKKQPIQAYPSLRQTQLQSYKHRVAVVFKILVYVTLLANLNYIKSWENHKFPIRAKKRPLHYISKNATLHFKKDIFLQPLYLSSKSLIKSLEFVYDFIPQSTILECFERTNNKKNNSTRLFFLIYNFITSVLFLLSNL